MPEDGHTTRVSAGEDVSSPAAGKDSSVIEAIWDDEDTRAFYECLPDLRFGLVRLYSLLRSFGGNLSCIHLKIDFYRLPRLKDTFGHLHVSVFCIYAHTWFSMITIKITFRTCSCMLCLQVSFMFTNTYRVVHCVHTRTILVSIYLFYKKINLYIE